MSNLIRYLRVSLINQCNLACSYCKPNSTKSPAVRRTAPSRFREAISLLHGIGIRKVRFTGGEPTLYKELPELVSFAKSLAGDMQVAITSNGLLLDRLAEPLADAGLDSVNISLDTTNRAKFTRVTGSDLLRQVMAGIEAAIRHIPLVKLNCVVMAGVNDDEAETMIRLADSLGTHIRFIEFMPTKLSSGHHNLFVSGSSLRNSLPFQLTLVRGQSSTAARYYVSDKLRIKVGFIDPVSHSFCANCDRIRLTSDGRLYGCLFSGKNFNLLQALEQGDEFASRQVRQLVAAKEYFGCAALNRRPDDLPSFVNIGG